MDVRLQNSGFFETEGDARPVATLGGTSLESTVTLTVFCETYMLAILSRLSKKVMNDLTNGA